MGNLFCNFTFSVQVEEAGAATIEAYGAVCPSGIGCGNSQHKFFYHVNWIASYTGPITIVVRRQRKNTFCNNVGGNDEIIRDTYFKEPSYGSYSFGELKLDDVVRNQINIKKEVGGTVKLSWNRASSSIRINKIRAIYSNGTYTEAGLTNPGDPGSNNYALNPIYLPRSTEGQYLVTLWLFSECGGVYIYGNASINVMPSCANDPATGPPYTNIIDVTGISPTTNPVVVDGGYNDNAQWKDGGGYEVDQNTTLSPKNYRITFSNVTDFATYYTVTANGSATDIPFTRTGTQVDFSVNASMGWYEFAISPITVGAGNYCRSYPNLNIFIGGRNRVFKENCIIYLPQYLIDQGVIGADKVALHFRSTVISSQGIIALPEMVLMDGAELKIEEGDFEPEKDIDSSINFTYSRVFDDYGRVIGESRNYFDDMGRATQGQIKNLTSRVVLASEQLYDKFGRPAITTLVAPISAPTTTLNSCGNIAEPWENLIFDYKQGFVVKSDNSKYDYTAFDNSSANATIENNPLPLGNGVAGTLGWYYSANNNAASTSPLKEPYVPTTSYPYSRVLYKDDGTNMVKGSASPGDYHRAGAGHVPEVSKDTVTSSDDFWLNRYLSIRNTQLIGYTTTLEQLKANVYKTISTDTEGRQAVVYLNKEGQNIISLYLPTPDEASFVFYDDAGRVRYSISPNGIKQYFGIGEYSTPVTFGEIDKTESIYNHRGWLIEFREKDRGVTKFMYRKDGSIRFSQNQEQAVTGKFSYTNYDKANRPIEGGEFSPIAGSGLELNFGYNNGVLKSLLEYGSLNHDLVDNSKGSKSDWMKSYYDFPDPSGIPDAEFTLGTVSYTENEAGAKTWYSFDERGRIVKTKKNIPGLGQKLIEYKYDAQGNIKEVAYQRGFSDAYYHYYEYTAGASLSKVYSGTVAPIYNTNDEIQNKTSLIPQAEYFYYKHGPLKRVDINQGLQGIDYVYTIQGWLKSLNHHDKSKDPGGDSDDLFGMSLEYFMGDYQKNSINNVSGLTNTQSFDGNIRAMNWYSEKGSSTVSSLPTTYAYEYDAKNQLVNATWHNLNKNTNTLTPIGNSYREGGMAYDANGNLKGIGRWNSLGTLINDFLPSGSPFNPVYKFNYAANSNKLNSVTGYSNYTNNTIGQVKQIESQTSARNMQMSYNVLGITEEINISGDPNVSKLRFTYDEGGNRIKKETFNNSGQEINELLYVYDDGGNLLSTYSKNIATNLITQEELGVYGASNIGTAYTGNSSYHYIYDLKDHLGSTRVRFSNKAGIPEVEAFYDYYPYGEVITDRHANGTDVTRNKYQGAYAEKDEETGFNVFQLRMYDPIIGRWMGPDSYRQFYSSYAGMGNNPANNIDPDGGYSWAGAVWRNVVYGGQGITKDELREPGNQYGYKDNYIENDPTDGPTPVARTQYGDIRYKSINVEDAIRRNKPYTHRFYAGSLDAPLIDPIDILAGGVVGLIKTGLKSGGVAAVKSGASLSTTSTSLVQTNRTAGNLFRDELAAALRAEGRTVNTEVFKKTPFGPRYMDLDVWHNGVNLGGIEAKVGRSRYLPLQKLKDAWLGANGYPVNLVRKPGTW